jgi:hypothetical protein
MSGGRNLLLYNYAVLFLIFGAKVSEYSRLYYIVPPLMHMSGVSIIRNELYCCFIYKIHIYVYFVSAF